MHQANFKAKKLQRKSLRTKCFSILFSNTEGPDYRFSTVSTNNLPAEWRLDIEDDDIALEYEDQLNLVYNPRPSSVIDRFEVAGQFVRSVVQVFIEDNDSKKNMYAVHIFKFKNHVNFPYDNRVRLHHLKSVHVKWSFFALNCSV